MDTSANPTRKWWKRRRGGSGVERDDGEELDLHPLDTQEQEDMVLSLERSHAQQSRRWRTVFAGFLLGFAAFLVYSIFHQTWYPWELRYHAYFMEDIHPWVLILADCAAVLVCLLAAKGMLSGSRSHRRWIWLSSFIALMLSFFWLYYMMRLTKFRWDAIWLPFGPLSGAAICLYVDHVLKDCLEDLKRLRSSMYNYKAI